MTSLIRPLVRGLRTALLVAGCGVGSLVVTAPAATAQNATTGGSSAPLPPPDGRTGAAIAQPGRTVTAETSDATRAELQAALATAERSGASAQANAIRQRLATGDFRVGDRFLMTLATDSVVQRELVVRDTLKVEMPPLAAMSVAGVLRSELQGVVLQHLKRYYRNPDVRVQLLTRVGVVGAVAKPGFYVVPPDAQLNDVLNLAGGTGKDSDVGKIQLYRYEKRLLDSKQFKTAARSGKTVTDLGIRSGDEIRVPEKHRISWTNVFWTVSILLTTILSLITLIRSVNNY